jgi:hypothetical protein
MLVAAFAGRDRVDPRMMRRLRALPFLQLRRRDADHMIFSYDVRSVGHHDLSAEVAREQGARRGLARPIAPGGSIADFVASLPRMLAAADFQAVIGAIVGAKQDEAGVVWGLGAHVIKTGLGRCWST